MYAYVYVCEEEAFFNKTPRSQFEAQQSQCNLAESLQHLMAINDFGHIKDEMKNGFDFLGDLHLRLQSMYLWHDK